MHLAAAGEERDRGPCLFGGHRAVELRFES
jgi:hypothetical protein